MLLGNSRECRSAPPKISPSLTSICASWLLTFPPYLIEEPSGGKSKKKSKKKILRGELAIPTISQHGRGAAHVKALRPLRGARCAALTHALLPGPSSPPCGECAGVALSETSTPKTQTGTSEVMVEADIVSPVQSRSLSRNGRMLLSDLLSGLPVHSSHQANTASFSTSCADSCFRASSIADFRIVDTPTDSRSCSPSLVTIAISSAHGWQPRRTIPVSWRLWR